MTTAPSADDPASTRAGAEHPGSEGLQPRVQVVGPLASAHVLWRSRGQLHVTILAKSTFTVVPGALMTAQSPDPIVDADVHHHDDRTQSVRLASDLVPYLARADVLFSGFAHATRGPTASMTVRLALLRDGHPLVDKSLLVVGDEERGVVRPFEVMALAWERSLGGIGSSENPLGTGLALGPSRRAPNVLSISDPQQTACFAPISRAFPVRARLLPAGVAPALLDPLSVPIVEVPEGFDWAYFQSAPADQQTPHLRGDEVLILEGLHPTLDRVESRLPGICALGRISGYRPGDSSWQPLAMRADTLVIDGARQRVTLTWRATVPVHDASRLGELQVQLLSSRASESAWWPDWDEDELATHAGYGQVLGATTTRHLTPAPRVERKTPGAGDTMVLDVGASSPPPPSARDSQGHTSGVHSIAAASTMAESSPAPTHPTTPPTSAVTPSAAAPEDRGDRRRELSLARTMQFIDEPTTEADPAVVELDLDMVLSQAIPSVDPATLPRAVPTEAPRTEREQLRETREVPVVADGPLAATTLAWRWEGRPGVFRTIVIKAIADLVHGGAALVREDAPTLRGSDVTTGEGDRAVVRHASDLSPVKPRVDVTMIGHARPAEGATRTARGEVRFAFGPDASSTRAPDSGAGFDRRIRVLGDRVWRDVVGELLPGQPEPFTAMPISWERAFGGTGWDANPAGVGYATSKTPPTRMPNLEWPERPIVHPRDKVKAAAFAPIPPWWPARAVLRGKSDDVYLHAPPEQRLDAVEGDESFVIEGVHPTLRRVEGTLPGERARCFAVREDGSMVEVRLRLDAVAFDADDLAVELVWRGVLEVAGPDARDLAAIYVRLDPMDEQPTSLEQCRAAYLAKSQA